MIDGTNIEPNSPRLHERLRQDEELTFGRGRDRHISENYRGLRFILHDSGRIEIRGSLHKYWNHGVHNWNDFTRVDLWDTIHEVCQRLQMEPAEALLHSVEFGVNVAVPFSAREFVGDVASYKNKPFGRVSVPKQGTYYKAETNDYHLKCYDKGTQYGQGENLLRFEIKTVQMRYLHGVGVRTLQDLLFAPKLAALGELLFQAWELVLVQEPLPTAQLTAKEQRTAEAIASRSRWQQLTPNQRYRVRKDYEQTLEYYLRAEGATDRKNVVGNLIRDKWEQLMKSDVCTDLQPATAAAEKLCLHRLSIVCNHTPPPTTPATPPPPPDESPTTAQKQHRRNKRRRTHHREEYYTKHNERNRRSNPANNLRRRVERAICQTSIFDPLEVIRLNPQQQQQMNYWKGTPWEIKGL